ncbi:hypothetical protein [Nocardia sp. NPDC003979]
MLTCVWRPETAACATTDPGAAPAWPRCRSSCSNITYTDRDITQLNRHITVLQDDLATLGIPTPLRHRLSERMTT